MHLAGLGLEGARGPACQSLHHLSVGSATGHGLSQLISILMCQSTDLRGRRGRDQREPHPLAVVEACSRLHYLSHLSPKWGVSLGPPVTITTAVISPPSSSLSISQSHQHPHLFHSVQHHSTVDSAAVGFEL